MTDITDGEKARMIRAAMRATVTRMPAYSDDKTLFTVVEGMPSVALAVLYEEIVLQMKSKMIEDMRAPKPQPKPAKDDRHPLDIPRPNNERPHGPLLVRNPRYGASGCGTPSIHDGDTARLLCYMNLSGAYGGCDGHAQAMRDATVFAAGYDLLDALREWERYGTANGGVENYSFLAATRDAIKKAGG